MKVMFQKEITIPSDGEAVRFTHEIHKLGYNSYDFALVFDWQTQHNAEYLLRIYSKNMLEDRRFKELLLEYLV